MAVNVIKRSWKVDRLVRPETLNGMTFQAESGGHRFEITGYDANGSMIAFGGTVTAVFLRPDNTDVALTGVLSNGIAQVTLTEECYQVPGRFGLAVFVNQNNTKTVVYDCIGTVARTSSGVAATSVVEDVSTLIDRIEAAVNSIPQDYSALSKAVGNITCPELRNGSTGNPWNTDSVTTKYIIKLDKTCDDLILEYIGNTSAAQYVFGYSIFKGVADGTESYEARSTAQSYADFPEQYVQTEPYVIIPMSQFGDYTHIAIVLWARSDETTYIPLRIATEQYNLRVTFRHASYMGHEDINNRSVKVGVQNAAKMASPLKLVHFSDLHKDINALNRIKASAKYVCPNADNIICTGDMVANTYAEITSWWLPEIMTVIGNHDTASWDGSAYDWTALSMAQRDEMYISPFKSYWGIVHTAGTSYYYKDYPAAHIRLIVMDAMLYSGTPGAEATAQTEWLAGLLSSAISNNLHVLIAIHAPHGGSVPVACSFTKLGQETMYVNVDCNTPDVVINTVATSIGNGLHFIGYICGHTHQDAIWDCTGDRSQLMYTVTCAAVDQTAQWENSDQYRSEELDAFNVLTIDTASTTIKILRGGGANTDGALRPRVSLVIDYSTGKIITDTYASGTQDAVVYGEAQTLTDAEKAQARTNIGAGSAADVSENTADITANANEITSLKSALSTIDNAYFDALIWEKGAINITTGADAPSLSRIRSSVLSKEIIAIDIASNYYAMICCYSGETYVGWWNGSTFSKADSGATQFTGTVNLATLLSAYNVRLYMVSSNGTSLSPSNDYQCVEFIKYTDDTLSKAGIPADAKVTGDKIDTLYTESQPYVLLTKSSDVFTVEDGYYATTGNKTALAGYRLCYFTATEDFNFYFDAETLSKSFALLASIYNTSIASGNNVVCYKRTDNSLPSQALQASIAKGQILAISIYTPSSSPADFGLYANYKKLYTLNNEMLLAESQIQQVLAEVPGGGAEKFTNYAYGKKIAWFGDSISELKQLPHTAGTLMNATVYDCSIRGSTIGRTYSNYDTFSFYNLVTAVISGDFSAQFTQLDAYEQAQGKTYPGIRENLTTLSTLDFEDVDCVVLLQGTNDFGITAVHATTGYDTKVAEMQARMDDAISRFITAYPKLKFYIISPPFRATPTEDYYGDTLADYIAAEQEVAEKYAMPFYNLLTHSRVCDENKTTYMNSDGGVYVHPNDYGDAWLAELVAKFISVN